jgi:hypothetical protein
MNNTSFTKSTYFVVGLGILAFSIAMSFFVSILKLIAILAVIAISVQCAILAFKSKKIKTFLGSAILISVSLLFLTSALSMVLLGLIATSSILLVSLFILK